MKILLPIIAAAILAPVASAQSVSEVAAMTVTHEVFDGDLLPAQPTVSTLSDINGATLSGGPLGLSNVTLTASGAALGLQSANIWGAALALDPGGSGAMMSSALGESFQAFNASIDLSGPSTEFGMAISDYFGGFIFDFYSGGVFVATITSSAYGNAGAEDPKFFQMTGGTFDRVDVYNSSTVANWAIASMFVETTGPAGPAMALSCIAGVATVDLSGMTANSAIAIVYGAPAVYVHGGNQCNGIVLDLTPAAGPVVVQSDANGDAQLVQGVPAAACGGGLLVQAADVATCVATNSAAL